jgi:hypothetical protein
MFIETRHVTLLPDWYFEVRPIAVDNFKESL